MRKQMLSCLKGHSRRLARRQSKTRCLTLLVIRITSTGELADSTPCNSCIRCMKKHKITRVMYSDHTGKIRTACPSHMDTYDSPGMIYRRGRIPRQPPSSKLLQRGILPSPPSSKISRRNGIDVQTNSG